MPLKENEVALAQAVNLRIQEEKRVSVTKFRIGSIEIRPEQKIVSAYILLRLDDDTELEKRVILLEGNAFDSEATLADFLAEASTKIAAMLDAGSLI